jgi:hypothetical protein
MFDFVTQTQLGRRFGVTSHVIGRWLVKIGLRNSDKTPSKKAIDGGFVKQHWDDDRGIWFPVWHAEKTIAALEESLCCRGETQSVEAEKGT